MSESKELLEATVKGLQEKIVDLNNDLKDKQHELENVNKPIMTGEMYDIIFETIEEGIGNFDFSDSDGYDIEYELDYDGRVNASSLEFNSASELTERIMSEIDSNFKISTSKDIK